MSIILLRLRQTICWWGQLQLNMGSTNLGGLVQLLEVIGLIGGVDKFVEGNGGKVANGNFVLAGVLQDLGAKVA